MKLKVVVLLLFILGVVYLIGLGVGELLRAIAG